MHTDRYVCHNSPMSNTSYFASKSLRWERILSAKASAGGDSSVDKSTETRTEILMAAFEEIYLRGFQAASLNNILKKTNITKGALYHHFKNKMELGYAVVDEVIADSLAFNWIEPLMHSDDPIKTLQKVLAETGEKMTDQDVRLGCPLNNLSQEMSPIDEGFRTRIAAIYTKWEEAIESACDRGKKAGTVRSEADSRQLAILFVATLEGCLGLAKSRQSLDILLQCGEGLIAQLELLRPIARTED